MRCKYCQNPAPKNMRGFCQACYKYFIIEKKTIHPLPEYGIISYAPSGNPICPFCGKEFRKLGLHFYYAHNLTSKEAHYLAGWDRNAKATHPDYRALKRSIQQNYPYTITENLIKAGEPTRYQEGHEGRTKNKMSEMTKRRLKRNEFRHRQLRSNSN